MTDTHIMARIAEMEKELAELKNLATAQDKPKSLIKNDVGSETDSWFITVSGDKAYVDFTSNMGAMIFSDVNQVKRYAEAFTTFIKLRKQPGSEAVDSSNTPRAQWVIRMSGSNTLEVASFGASYRKMTEISCCFNSKESAIKAMDTVGAENILQMFRNFHS